MDPKEGTSLFTTNAKVQGHNNKAMETLWKDGEQIFRFDAKNSSTQAMNCKDQDKVRKLDNYSYFAIGAKVVLTCNLSQNSQLVNGSCGTIVGFDMREPPPKVPQAVIVHFPDYKGKAFFVEHPTWVPIEQYTATFRIGSSNRDETRTQIPLKLSYAWTIHKGQGQTFPGYLFVDLGETDKHHKSAGLNYVALSRSKDAAFFAMVGVSRDFLTKPAHTDEVKDRILEEERLRKLAEGTAKFVHDGKLNYAE